ncbi:molecular chaperone [Aliivibrio sp. S10_S31]|uniref:molecular chaperone n=1 Tax=Aliivibrio sp. S10_S31 TaxID=2720224 RepID=UPI0016806E47|nr:molecular chaperone [Aliivibrio sp. S10_S31]MBD1569427.1 molecular chaperone [Aliivibrio sp. S10_S31]
MKKQIYVFLLTLIFPFHLSAFELFPMVNFFSDHGKDSSGFFKITNASLQPLPVEIEVRKRQVTGEESEVLIESADIFVFPLQALIAPGASQTIKVQYIGSPKEIAESYRLIVSQLPLKDEMGSDSIQMLFRIGGLVFVSPNKVNETVKSQLSTNENNQSVLMIDNVGSSVVDVSKQTWNVSLDDKKYTWKWSDIEPFISLQYLVPGQSASLLVSDLTQ